MADDAVKPRINELLPLLYFNGAGEIGVFPHDLGVQSVGQQKDHACCANDHRRKMAPAKAEVQCRQQKAQQKLQSGQADHFLLGALFFLGIQAFGQQVGSFQQEEQPQKEHGYKEQRNKQPAVGIGDASRRNKEQNGYQDQSGNVFAHSGDQQLFLHGIPSFSLFIVAQIRP